MNKPGKIYIRPDEIRLEFIRSSGPGGQNVNKVATAVQLRFDVQNSQSLRPEARARLIQLSGKRINQNGELVIEARRFRSQQMNREDALERLNLLIEKASIPPKARHKTRPSRAARQRRLEAKHHRSETKKFRRSKEDD